ncbi:PGRP and LysM peptidoglycan-binding domain-containing protein [Sorangium sp. So ce1000]|uniref:PGRP and LysM peptidoglycan-binding domain-containing protein n=1 Tax=Sorangium sp. So ce1000 TaxID=3133325 RepID=UPI003F61DF00
MPAHRVQQGECLSTIAARYGFRWRRVWEHPDNEDLRALRKSPNVLHPGDVVHIPDRPSKTEGAPTGQRTRFALAQDRAALHLRLVENEEPVANTAYVVEIDGAPQSGTTDGDGKLEIKLPEGARRARLTLAGRIDEYILRLGYVDPVTEVSGLQARLHNLGFYQAAIDGRSGERVAAAIREFQATHGLEVTGEPDDPTREKLSALYGC